PITIGSASSPNYTISYTPGTLTVTKAALTLVADDKSKVYGAGNPALTFHDASGHPFVNGDTAANLTTQPSLATAAPSAGVGSYAITIGGAVSPNYTISYTAATLTVTPVALTLVADDKTKVYGAANPPLTFHPDPDHQFVNGDTAGSLVTQPTLSTTPASSPVASYPITIGGATSPNYT